MQTTQKKKSLKIKYWSIVGIILLLTIGFILINYVIGNLYNTLYRLGQTTMPEQTVDSPIDVLVETPLALNRAEEEPLAETDPVFKKIDISTLEPVESYLVIRRELSKVRRTQDLITLVEMYGSARNITAVRALGDLRDMIGEQSISPIVIANFTSVIKSAELISMSTNEATLKIILESGEEGRATMVRERGTWLLDEEVW